MKVLVLASGGDAPGMNKFIATLYKKYGKSLYACRGFKGLYENEIFPASHFKPLKHENEPGCCIYACRFPEFKEKKYFEVAVQNAKNFDAVVVLGGNGSKRGVRALADNGVRAVFVPGTIDNDVEESATSIGFDTAVTSVVNAVNGLMPSMRSHTRAVIVETMGRNCGEIALAAGKKLGAEVIITQKEQLDEEALASLIKTRYEKNLATLIVIKENICDIAKLATRLAKVVAPAEVKSFVVGHLQRGSQPSAKDLSVAHKFAHGTIKAIGTDALPIAVMLRAGHTILKKI